MPKRYLCPQCGQNRTHFYLVKKLAQEVRKDPSTGKITWAADEWEEVWAGDTLFLEVKCADCGYLAKEKSFT